MPAYPARISPTLAGNDINAALARMRAQIVGAPEAGGLTAVGADGGDQINGGYPSREAILGALPPRLQAAVAAGRQSPESALNRFGQFQAGQLPGQQANSISALDSALAGGLKPIGAEGMPIHDTGMIAQPLPLPLSPAGARPRGGPATAPAAPTVAGPSPAAAKPIAAAPPAAGPAQIGAAPVPAAQAAGAMKPAAPAAAAAQPAGNNANRINSARNVLREQVRRAMGRG